MNEYTRAVCNIHGREMVRRFICQDCEREKVNIRPSITDEEIEKEANGRYIAFEGSIQYQWAQDRKRGFLECAKWLRERIGK